MHRACYTLRRIYWREDCSVPIGAEFEHERRAGGGFHESSSQRVSPAWVASPMESARGSSSRRKGPRHQQATGGFSHRTLATLVSAGLGGPGLSFGPLRTVKPDSSRGLDCLSNG